MDIGKTYLSVIGPDGTIHDGMPMAMPVEDGPPSIVMPTALDAKGSIYFQGMGGMADGPPDSTFISRYDRATAQVEPAVSLWRPAPNIQRSGGNVRMMSTQMEGRDDWAVGPDGRIAVVRANGYRVDWYLPDGGVVTGPETPYERHPISQQDKEQALEERNTGGLMMMVTSGSSGGGSISMSRGGSMRMAGGDGPAVDDFQWAEEFPAFRPNRSMVSRQNEVWVQRYLPGNRPQEMDVFGPDGVRIGSIELPAGARLIGFGHGPQGGEVAYLVRTDEVGLQWLERYRVVRG